MLGKYQSRESNADLPDLPAYCCSLKIILWYEREINVSLGSWVSLSVNYVRYSSFISFMVIWGQIFPKAEGRQSECVSGSAKML